MFPKGEETLPTIRFNLFVETWKQDEFGKVIKLVGGATPLKGNKEYWIGDIVWLSSQEIKNKYVSKGTYTISEKAVRDNRTKVVPLGTPLIVTRSGILAKRFPISISLNEVAINQDIKALIFDKTKIDPEFIVAQIKAKESYILNNIVKTGTTVQSVNLPDLNRMILHIPEYEEQVKIGEFFRQLDEVVDLKEQELEALIQTKKGFLQKMFV
ncbi:restriction endonuclease subunit S [Exiguobacterium sp. s161]|uniref:restriction endonuclease subunit S n=1 Tax=Exiguobacterium sp. s161 TaxID=2751191 RepID=UPI001BE589D6|nr:restriction endonuclease subunit S [Exiguobacterium sp. s161]